MINLKDLKKIKEEVKKYPRPIKEKTLKKIFDKVFSGGLIILISPILIIITIAMLIEFSFSKKTRGSIFYKEKRFSLEKEFRLYKFRTVLESSIKGPNLGIAEKDEKNKTLVGSFLKKFYLDELPQIFNVFRGEMSIVGTRPWDTETHKKALKKGEINKIMVKPGITGLVGSYKGSDNFNHNLDYVYIHKYKSLSEINLLLYDCSILARSFIVLLKGEGI
jgi:lipopolysaccharide/colanic/teichoic acid biosynthesis glycosyltransferase